MFASSAQRPFQANPTPNASRPARSLRACRTLLACGIAPAAAAALLCTASPAAAHLGSIRPADGYLIAGVGPFPADWVDVTYYNAGAFGANAGGGSVALIAPDSGNWSLLSSPGAFFTSAAARNAALGGAPPYPNAIPAGTVPAYMVGNHFPGRGGDGSNLAFRNDTALGSGSIKYRYQLDTYDTGGPVPSSVTGGTVSTEFYFCPNPGDSPMPGTPRQDKFAMGFLDGTGNLGLQWGYARDNEVTWRTSASGNWNYTGIYANATNWDGVRLNIDLTGGTFELDYYIVSSNTWTNLAPAGTALGMTMSNFTTLDWELVDGLSAGIGGKNFFDDFTFNIPAPSSLALVGLGLLTASRRRRATA